MGNSVNDLKSSIKYFLGYIRGAKAKIFRGGKSIYIGNHANIKGGKNIMLSECVIIRPEVDLWCGSKARINIGRGTEIGERCRISIVNCLDIGSNVLLSPNVYITDCDHRYDQIGIPVSHQGICQTDNRVKISDDVYIGINSVIVGNVTIGKGSVIGANSVVTNSIPNYCVAVGAPCRVIKQFNSETSKWEYVQ
ncbi:acyltransferase [Clostridium lacusfryxellense]|uniref:acyltransferase n=1 Tax=Clostridium lacusfryxellense TaxID=205328 RepID=UPI001C0A9ACC|nr:acyltransferase [Clostridium lacusfryxellense]MBU3111069.1 acyltransferase [Clostridium lacusfryxellense]